MQPRLKIQQPTRHRQSTLREIVKQVRSFVASLLSAAGRSNTAPKIGNVRVPQPAKPVDLDRYAGHWYEFARYENRFEKSCEGVTAEYAMRSDGLLSVTNRCRRGGVDGPLRVSVGRAKVTPNSANAKLKVSFFGPFYLGNYWVLDLATDYSWSIVGEPSGRYLWILTRVEQPDPILRIGLLRRVTELGYDLSILRQTQH